MKTSLLIIVLLSFLSPLTIFAQYNFPIADMQKLCGKNASDFETVVMGKDYSVQSKLSTAVMKVYTSDKAALDGKKYTISRYQVPNAMARITFSTTDKKFYLDVKAHLATNGLKFVKEEARKFDGTDAACYNYATASSFHVALCSYTTDVPWYVIEVHF